MALVQPTNLNAYYGDLEDAKRNLASARAAVADAEARLVEAGGKLHEDDKPKKAPKKGKK